jgi:hypothetical protein
MMELNHLDINIEKLVQEDPLRFLNKENHEDMQKKYGKYYKFFEDEISMFLANKSMKNVSRSTSERGISAIFYDPENSYSVIVSEYTRQNPEGSREEFRVSTANADFLFELSKRIIERVDPGINDYLKITN